jgi:hypothetical protein
MSQPLRDRFRKYFNLDVLSMRPGWESLGGLRISLRLWSFNPEMVKRFLLFHFLSISFL